MTVTVLTCATSEEGYYPSLVASCKKYGYKLLTVGMGMEWKGFTWSQTILLEGINQIASEDKYGEDALLIVVDGYDTIMTMPSFLCEMKYLSIGRDSVLVCEEHPLSQSPFLFRTLLLPLVRWYFSTDRVLNSGVVMGRASSLRSYFHYVSRRSSLVGDDDERALNILYREWSLSSSSSTPPPFPILVTNSVFECVCNRSVPSLFLQWMFRPYRITGADLSKGEREEVAVLHGIWNSDMDDLCLSKALPLPKRRKAISQKDLSILTRFRWVFAASFLYLLVSGSLKKMESV